MPAPATLRRATLDDASACQRIYAYYVDNSAATFETEAPDVAEMRTRMEKILATHDWLVAEVGGDIVGFAYAGPFHQRSAYQWSVETTIYLAHDVPGRGIGRLLYTEILQRMTDRGFTSAVALVAKPNEASEGLHRAFGFEPVGTLQRIGFKHGQWRDVCWWQRPLAPYTDDPQPPAAADQV